MRRRAFFGLGSNLGDRWTYLQAGVDALAVLGRDLAVSRVYATEPVGGPDGQGDYLNCVAVVTTELAPLVLLEAAHEIESAAHRVRAERFGPRTLDVDVLWIDGYYSDDPVLTVPHPRMAERAFVLAPLAELAPDIAGAGWVDRLGGPGAVSEAARPVGAMLHLDGELDLGVTA